MAGRYQLFALVALLSIVVVSLVGPMAAFSINPEIAAGHPNYVRNFRLLSLAKTAILIASALIDCGLWVACCAFLLKAKERSYGWLTMALLGPYGLAIITVLNDRSPDVGGRYRGFIGRMKPLARIAYEIAVFVVIVMTAYVATVVWSGLSIEVESMRTGVSVAEIIEQRNASSGMWAFGDQIREFYLVAIFYLLWSMFLNALDLYKRSTSSRPQ